MKKVLSAFLAVALVVAMLPLQAFAAWPGGITAPSLSLSTNYDANTQKVTAEVAVSDYAELAALQFTLNYDTTKLTVSGTPTVSTQLTNTPPDASTVTAGKVIFLWTDNDAGTTGGRTGASHVVLNVVFDVVPGANGAADFSIDGFAFTHKSGDEETANPSGTNAANETLIAQINSAVALTGTLSTPTKSGTDASSLSGSNVSATVNWTPTLVGGKFEADTAYKATVTVAPAANYTFGTGASVSFTGLTFTKSGNNFVAEKDFPKTETKTLTSLTVTAQPTNKEYHDGDVFNPVGMVVKAVYDDATQNDNFTGYTVAYENGAALKKGDTKVTLTAGSQAADITGLTVSGKAGTPALFTYTTQSLTYNTMDQKATIEGMITAKGTDITRGVVAYTYQKDGVATSTIKDAGDYTILASIAGGTEYDATADIVVGTFTIDDKTIAESDFTVLDTSDKVYTGSQIAPAVTSTVLVAGTDYDVTYGANKAAAVNGGSITIIGKGNCTGTITKNFTITPIVLNSTDLEYTGAAITKVYDGNNASTLAAVSVKAGVLKAGDSLTVAGTAVYNSKDVMTANKITFTPVAITTGNYTLASSQSLDVAATITATTAVTDTTPVNSATAPIAVVKGDGSFPQPTFTGVGGETPTGSTVYSYDGVTTYDAIKQKLAVLATDATAEIDYTFTGSGNYSGTTSGKMYIKVADLEFTIDSAAVTSTNAVTLKSTPTYGDRWSDIVSIKDNIVATVGGVGDNGTGVYSLEQTGFPAMGDNQSFKVLYTGTIGGKTYTNVVICSGTVNIAPKTLTVSDLEYTGAVSKVYDGGTTTSLASVNVKAASLINGDTLTVAGTAAFNSDKVSLANKVTFTTSAITTGNYRLAAGLTLDIPATITRQPIVITVQDIAAVDYDGTEKKPSVIVKSGETTLNTSEYTVSYSNNINATDTATATVKTADTGNYSFADTSKEFIINKIAYSGTTSGTSSAKHGNNGAFDFSSINIPDGCVFGTISIVDTDNVLAGTPTMSGNKLSYTLANDLDKAGKTATVTVPVTASRNYTPFDLTVSITCLAKQAQDGFAFTEPTQTKAYADDDFTVAAVGNASGSTVTYKSSDTSVASVDNTGKVHILEVGSTVITATASETSEYAEKEVRYTLTVNKSTLTVKPMSFSIYNGEQKPTLGVEYVGLKAGETSSAVAMLNSGTLAMQIRNAANNSELKDTKTNGLYKIIFVDKPVFHSSANYDIVLGEGTLKIQDNPNQGNSDSAGDNSKLFAISVSYGKGGYINTANTVSVGIGESAGFGIFADAGYRIADVKVDGKSVGAVNYYVFTNVQENHNITAYFTKGSLVPKTGDPSNMALWICLMITGLILMVIGVVFYRRKKHE